MGHPIVIATAFIINYSTRRTRLPLFTLQYVMYVAVRYMHIYRSSF